MGSCTGYTRKQCGLHRQLIVGRLTSSPTSVSVVVDGLVDLMGWVMNVSGGPVPT
jgi:hypothetical protein